MGRLYKDPLTMRLQREERQRMGKKSNAKTHKMHANQLVGVSSAMQDAPAANSARNRARMQRRATVPRRSGNRHADLACCTAFVWRAEQHNREQTANTDITRLLISGMSTVESR